MRTRSSRGRHIRALRWLLLAAWAVPLASPATAVAHVPALEPGYASDVGNNPSAGEYYPRAIRIDNPSVSRALYGYLTADEGFDVWSTRAEETVVTDVGLLVPVRLGTGAFRPRLRVAREPEPEQRGPLPGPSGLTDIATVESPTPTDRSTFFEPFSFEWFYESGSQSVSFEPGYRYYLLVDGGSGRRDSGPYTITFSGRESFGGDDVVDTIAIMPRIYLGLYGQSPLRWGTLTFWGILVATVVWGVVRRRRRHGRDAGEWSG